MFHAMLRKLGIMVFENFVVNTCSRHTKSAKHIAVAFALSLSVNISPLPFVIKRMGNVSKDC